MNKITHKRRKPSSRRSRPESRLRRVTFEALEQRRLLSINVTLYRYDSLGTGVDPSETVLTPANVASSSFGEQFTVPLDGQVYATPLYMSSVTLTGGTYAGSTHNVVYVATENDSLYAIDAANGTVLWQDSFLINTSGAPNGSVTITTVPSGDVDSTDINPQIGITGTPAIDPNTGSLYVVGTTKDVYANAPNDPQYVLALYKVNIASGSYTYTIIADTTDASGAYYYYPAEPGNDANGQYDSGPYVLGNGNGNAAPTNVGGQNRVYFNALRQMFRPSIELDTINGQNEVVLASASHGDIEPYHGWMLTYNESDLALTGVLCTTPNGQEGGIWGGTIVTDGQGDFYFETGNGTFDGSSINAQGFPSLWRLRYFVREGPV